MRSCCAALTDATSVKIQHQGLKSSSLKLPDWSPLRPGGGLAKLRRPLQGGAHRGPIIGDFLLRRPLQVDLAPTSTCLPAKSEPSAFKSRTMSSMLSPPNSLKGATPHVVYCVTSWQDVSTFGGKGCSEPPVDVGQVLLQDEGLVRVQAALQTQQHDQLMMMMVMMILMMILILTWFWYDSRTLETSWAEGAFSSTSSFSRSEIWTTRKK